MFRSILKRSLGLAVAAILLAAQGAYALTIDFRTSGPSSGTVAIVGGNLVGTSISIGQVEIVDAKANNGVYAVSNGFLNFNTTTGSNFITITGGIGAMGIADGSTLLKGTVSSWQQVGTGNFFLTGVDFKNADLLKFIGAAANTEFALFGTELTTNWNSTRKSGTAISTDMKNTAVPEPTSLLLLGSGLIGVGLVRRKIARG